MSRKSREERLHVLKLICRNNGVRDICEISDWSPNTVRKFLAECGEATQAFHNRTVVGLSCTRLEIDEIWSYLYCKQDQVGAARARAAEKAKTKPATGRRKAREVPERAGDLWTWTAFDPDSKLFVDWHVAGRGVDDCLTFIESVRSRVEGRMLITTDGLTTYQNCIEAVFRDNADHVVIRKVLKGKWDYETGTRSMGVLAMHKELQSGREVDLTRASTSLAERHHATMRTWNPRLNRQTYRFSKKYENDVHVKAIYALYYNFKREHAGLRGITPAMAAGLTDKLWSFEDMLDVVDAHTSAKRARPEPSGPPEPPSDAPRPLEPGERTNMPYAVVHSLLHRRAVVHMTDHGLMRIDASPSTRRYGCSDLDEANALAADLAPEHNGVCAVCITRRYHTRKQPT